MRIAIDARMYGTEHGGIGRYIVNLVDQLQKIDSENEYKILLRSKYFKQLKTKNNWEKVLADVKHYSFYEQILITRILNNIKPDLVHFPHFNIPILYQGKFFVTIHDLLMHKRQSAATTLPLLFYMIKHFGYKLVFKRAIQEAIKVIVPSNFVKNEISAIYPESLGKLEVIYEGVDKNVSRGLGGYLRRNHLNKPYFLYVGSVYPHKNVERAIEAAVFCKKTLVIVTPRNIFLKRLIKFVNKHSAYDYVKFTGYVEDNELSTLYKNAEAFVYPSLEEGFGLPGLEAMANGCLVLASNIPVFREIYKDNAIYFNPFDFSSISRAMEESLKMKPEDKNKIIVKAKLFVEKYSWQENAKSTLRLYQEAGNFD